MSQQTAQTAKEAPKKAVAKKDMSRAAWTWKEMKRNWAAYIMVAPFMIVFKLCLVGVDDTPVAWWQILIKGIILFFLYLPMPCLYALMELGFLSGFSVLVTDFLGIFNLFALGSLMGLVLLCSIFFTFFRKEKKQTFS